MDEADINIHLNKILLKPVYFKFCFFAINFVSIVSLIYASRQCMLCIYHYELRH